MKNLLALLTLFVIVCGLSVPATAALVDRGGGLIYDSYFDITWLQDANYAVTSGYETPYEDGSMNWNESMTWVDGMEYYDSVRNVTWEDWRLPTALNKDGSGPCHGYNCTESEMGHLYYVEGVDIPPDPDDIFFNVGLYHWSSTEYAPMPDIGAWKFNFFQWQAGREPQARLSQGMGCA